MDTRKKSNVLTNVIIKRILNSVQSLSPMIDVHVMSRKYTK